MSETTDDRAAKAARAKALLAKKRQQKKDKAGDSISALPDSAVASPVIPARTFSPAPAEVAATTPSPPAPAPGADLGDLFSKGGSDTSDWLSSLPRAENASSPPPPPPQHQQPQQHQSSSPPPLPSSVSSHVSISSTLADAAPDKKQRKPATPAQSPPTVSSPPPAPTARPDLEAKIDALGNENARLTAELERLQDFETAAQQAQALLESERVRVRELTAELDKLKEETEIALRSERQTVSLLVNEKASLSAELQKREEFETRVQTLEELLASEKHSNADLTTQARRWESEAVAAKERVTQLSSKEKELVERLKEQERQLQLVTASSNEFKKTAEDTGRRLRELEEQIQADDRIDKLESSLKNTQDRADSLEASLSKLKNAHVSIKAERDAFDAKCQQMAAQEVEWSERLSTLEGKLKDTDSRSSQLSKDKDELSAECSRLRSQSDEKEAIVKDLRQQLAQASSNASTTSRQLSTAQTDLKAAIRRAEDAEKAQKALQSDGNDLMRSVNEMRPKIVELTTAKLELSEKVQSLEHALRGRDATISQLEGDLDEAKDGREQSQKVLQDKLTQQEKQLKDAKRDHEELQKAYSELQEELDSALVSLRSIESQRNNQHQDAARRIEEQERLTNTCHSQETELKALRAELEKQRQAHEELEIFLDDARNDIEGLRADLHVRDQEIELLRETLDSANGAEASRSLDSEMVNSLRQQHALDLSAASSQVRALEDIIFERETSIHALQKQVSSLEEQLSQLRSNGRAGNGRFSPAPSSRPHSRALDNDHRRASFGSSRGNNNPQPLSRSVFEHNMTPEQIRKRKVSLSMLKARIDSEVAAAAATTGGSGPPSRSLSPVQSEGHRSSLDRHPHHHSPLSQPPHHRPQFLDESHVFWCHSCQGDLVIL